MSSRRIRGDHEDYELRNARVFRARKTYRCDHCEKGMSEDVVPSIVPRTDYVFVSTGLRFCNLHFTRSDVVEVEK